MTVSKRIFCILICLLSLMSVPMAVSAGDVDVSYTHGDFEYRILEDETVCISAYNGEGGDVLIPSEIDGKSVVTIGDEIFWYREDLTGIIIPETIEYIGARVFQGCTALEEVRLPDSVAEIGDSCFLSCSNLKKINVPANLVYVGAFAFDETPWVTRFDGSSCIILGGRVFYKYLSDEDMAVIPDDVVCISGNAFDGKKLSYVSIPDSVAFVGDYCFYNCPNLKSIKLPSNIYYLGDNSLGLVPGATEVEPVKGFTIYAEEGSIGAEYATKYDVELKSPEDFVQPENVPEALVCVSGGDIKTPESKKTVGLTQGGVITIILIIGGCVVVIGGIALVSWLYEKKRKSLNKETNKTNKKKK